MYGNKLHFNRRKKTILQKENQSRINKVLAGSVSCHQKKNDYGWNLFLTTGD